MRTKLGLYFRLICRRERLITPIWMLSLLICTTLFAALFPLLLTTEEELLQLALGMSNQAMVAMVGPVYGLEQLSQASIYAQESLLWFLIAIALMNIFLVNRHTRRAEELGQMELVRSLAMSKWTPLTALMLFVLIVNIVLGALITLFLPLSKIAGLTLSGALLLGLVIAATGIFFAACTLFAAQIFSSAQQVSIFGVSVVLLSYVWRAWADMQGSQLTNLSPLGLGLQSELFYSDNFQPSLLLLKGAVVLTGIAMLIYRRRDVGRGVVAVKQGRVAARSFLLTPMGWAWRLTRTSLLAWAGAIFLLGAAYGSVVPELESFVSGNEMIRGMLELEGISLLDSYSDLIFLLMSVIIAFPMVQTLYELLRQERSALLEHIYSRALSRKEILFSFYLLGFVSAVVLMVLLVLGLFVSSSGAFGLISLLRSGFVYVPALWFSLSLMTLLLGWRPNAVTTIYFYLGYAFLSVYVSKIVEIPSWVSALTPFGFIASYPLEKCILQPMMSLLVVALGALLLGLRTYQKRDLLP